MRALRQVMPTIHRPYDYLLRYLLITNELR
jgi:hypothetical protein